MKARFLALAALVLGLASCQTEPEGLDVNVGGEEVNTVLTVTIPETETRAGGEDSAIGAFGNVDFSQYDVRFILEVYNMEGKLINELAKERLVNTEDEAKSTSFDLRLIPGRDYRFVVWADIVAEGTKADLHYNTANLKEVKLATNEWNLTDETRDAYTNIYDVTDFTSASNISIELKRPLGKLRVVTTDIKDMFNVLPEDIKVVYSTDIYTSFNAFTSDVIAAEKVTYEKSIKISENKYANEWDAATGKSKGTMTLFTDYYFASKDQEEINFTLDVKDNNGDAFPQVVFNTPIPIQRNYLTTVMGPILTDAANVNVYINDAFDGYHEVDADIKEQLEEAAKYKNYVIDLEGDLIWETGGAHGSTPLIPEGAVTETLTINGNGYKVIATGAGVGPIRMANGGKLIFNEVTLVDQTKSYNEGAWELCYLEVAGNLEFNNCVIDNTIAIDGEKAVFNNCTFNDKVFAGTEGQEYAAWVSNGEVEFNGCEFSGARGIKVHEAYGSEVAKVVVDNCQFNNLSKKPGMAIGTVNAATKIEIKNSVFNNCQPGDQGLYMYETDTDVATFDFSQTNNTVNVVAATSEALAKVLKADFHTLNISLAGDVTVDVSAHIPSYYFGGENTNTITIDGAKVTTAAATGADNNAYKLTFNHTNSDWNYVRLANDEAKWVIKNVKLTNSGYNDGPWNRHDISFYNDVELVNVTSDKAIALFGDSDLTNVVISDVHTDNSDMYALWIRPLGQTVNIKDCALLAHETKSGDRGIKIDNQYVNEGEAKVTLNVDGLKVKSQKKAAILVKSKAGADINIKNIDITEVAADNANAVWVDESTKAYAGLVSVTGGSKDVEGLNPIEGETTEDVQTALNAAVATENVTVQLPAGEYTLPTDIAPGVTIVCDEGVVFKGNHSLNINGAIINGGTFSAESGRTVTGTVNATLRGCTFEGANALRYCYSGENCVFEDCVFDGVTYGAHFDGGDYPLTFIRCTFSGFNAFGSKIPQLTMIDCVFKSTGKSGYNGANLWGTTTMTNTTFVFDGSTSTEWIGLNAAGSGKVISLDNCTVTNGSVFDYFANWEYGYKVTVDGVVYEFVADGVMKADEVYEISSKAGMFWFANEVNVNKNAFSGKTVKLAADIDLENAAWTPVGQTGATTFNGVFDGQNYTISNLNVDSKAQTGAYYSSGLFGWVESHSVGHGHLKNVKIDIATIVGNHNCGALVGYITDENALVENCHVTGATVSCLNANSEANGDKAGALIGNATIDTPVKNCTAANSTVSAGRDAGQVIGAGREANVTGCSATEVTVEANGTGTGNNVRNEVIGRLL